MRNVRLWETPFPISNTSEATEQALRRLEAACRCPGQNRLNVVLHATDKLTTDTTDTTDN
jgi:hypothetical protein